MKGAIRRGTKLGASSAQLRRARVALSCASVFGPAFGSVSLLAGYLDLVEGPDMQRWMLASLSMVIMGIMAALALAGSRDHVQPRPTKAVGVTGDTHPPLLAEYLLWYLPRKDREAVMGDLEEEFHIVYKRFGRRKAIIWYYYQVGASFWPYAVSGIEKFIKWGILGWVGDLFRRIIS